MAKLAQYKVKLLDEFEGRIDDWTYVTFEKRLGEIKKGATYHDAKGVLVDAHKEGRWPNTVKRYLFTNCKLHGNVSIELVSTFNDIYFSLPSAEREVWKSELKLSK